MDTPPTICISSLCCSFEPTTQVDTIDRGGLAIVGNIPAGLPPWTANQWAISTSNPLQPSLSVLFPTAIVVLFVDLLESTSIARFVSSHS